MTVMGDASMDGFSDAGSIPARSTKKFLFKLLDAKNKSKWIYQLNHIQRNLDVVFLLGQSPVFIVKFFVVPKNGTLKTNKPPAMQVSQHCFSLQ